MIKILFKFIKQVMAIILSLIIWLCPVFSVYADGTREPSGLYSVGAVLMDADSGRVLFANKEDKSLAMASTTKIMTCILALELGNPQQVVIFSENAASMPDVQMNAKAGERYYLKDLLYSTMLESHNDSAVAVAEAIAGSVQEFTKLMNQKAEAIGCVDTHFVTPNGLDGEDEDGTHRTTAKELAMILRYCISVSSKSAEFLEITGSKLYEFQELDGKRYVSCRNHNAFLEIYEGAFTGKTGFTGKAGYCYAGAVKRDERTFIIALLGAGWYPNRSYKWRDAAKLFDYGFENFQYRNLGKNNWNLPNISVQHGMEEQIKLTTDAKEFSYLLGKAETVKCKIVYQKELLAPVEKNAIVGTICYELDGKVIEKFHIYTGEAIAKKTFWNNTKMWLRKLVKKRVKCLLLPLHFVIMINGRNSYYYFLKIHKDGGVKMSNKAQSLASKRIASLLDENSFVEIGGMVTSRNTDFNMQTKETPADGCVTGYGVIDGNLVYVYSQDAGVLNGSVGEMHAKKIANLYNLALKTGAPVIGLIDSAGLRLQEATDALNAFGEIYMKQTNASGVIPQITAIFGNCGGGLAMIPTLTDFTFMEAGKAKLFVNSPNAIAGNEVSKCDTASAKFQMEEVGIVDVVAEEAELMAQIRELVCLLPANNEEDGAFDECTDDLNRVCADLENAVADPAIVLSNISDDAVFFETKKDYAKEMVTGFIKLNGVTVGAVANRTVLFDEEGNKAEEFEAELTARGCLKAAQFVNFCDAFNIPVLTLTNVNGFKATMCSERNIASAAAKLTYAFGNATVPKVNVIVGKAFGNAYNVMNSKAIGADMVYAWPNAEIGMMDATLAAKVMYGDTDAATVKEKAAEYAALQNNVVSAARRGYVDTIIEAQDTRKYVIGAFEMLFTKRDERPAKKHGTV